MKLGLQFLPYKVTPHAIFKDSEIKFQPNITIIIYLEDYHIMCAGFGQSGHHDNSKTIIFNSKTNQVMAVFNNFG